LISLSFAVSTPEVELLLSASCRYQKAFTEQQIARLAGMPIDWPYVLGQARRHGVVPLLYHNLCTYALAQVPHSVRAELGALYRDSALRNLYLLGELLKIVTRLERRGIRVIPFKGPLLASSAFGDVSLRQFSDLDILVAEQDIDVASAQLSEMGFRCAHRAEWVQPYLRFGHELDFVRDHDHARVDLQWRFAKKWVSFPVDVGAIWERSVVVQVGDISVRQPCPEDGLIILCAHAYRHGWSHLKWISDVQAFVHVLGPGLDWPQLSERARESGGQRLLALGLWLAQALGGSDLPEPAAQLASQDVTVEELGRNVLARLFNSANPIGPRGNAGLLADLAFHLQARERMKDRFPIMKPLLEHADYLARRYGSHYARRLFGSRVLSR